MAHFEDAIQWMMSGGFARRCCWAKIPEYTRTTPPLAYDRIWRIWMPKDIGDYIIQGWGGQIGFELDSNDPVRDGTYYTASHEDRNADDWELFARSALPRRDADFYR